MKEFNLEEYLKDPSKKVVTRDGREVRIICTDMKSVFPIVALIYDEEKQKESIECFFENGKYLFFDADDSPLDLFLDNIKKEGWVNIYKDNITTFTSSHIHTTEKQAQEEASESLKEYGKFIATIKIEWEE